MQLALILLCLKSGTRLAQSCMTTSYEKLALLVANKSIALCTHLAYFSHCFELHAFGRQILPISCYFSPQKSIFRLVNYRCLISIHNTKQTEAQSQMNKQCFIFPLSHVALPNFRKQHLVCQSQNYKI